MLIKSMDGSAIVNTNTLVSLNVFEGRIYCNTTNSREENGFVMGEYNTDYEAQAALDNLFDAIDEPKYDLGGDEK